MAPTKKSPLKDTAVEEIDLLSIDIDTIDMPAMTPTAPQLSESKKSDTHAFSDAHLSDEESPEEEAPSTDDFDDDFDDPFILDTDSDDEEGEKPDGYVAPKDFFTDKRRKKNLKKFLDVTVPPEILEGMPEPTQLLFKKGKAEGRLVYDEVMAALPPGDDIEVMDEVFSRLAKLGVELVDSLDHDEMFRDAGKKKDEVDLSEISDDSIRMYLNEI